MLVDLHLHTVRNPGLERSNGKTFATPAQLVQRMDEIGVGQGVLLPIVSPEGSHLQVSTEEVLEAAQDFPGRFIPFCNVDPRADTNTQTPTWAACSIIIWVKGVKGSGRSLPIFHGTILACKICSLLARAISYRSPSTSDRRWVAATA